MGDRDERGTDGQSRYEALAFVADNELGEFWRRLSHVKTEQLLDFFTDPNIERVRRLAQHGKGSRRVRSVDDHDY